MNPPTPNQTHTGPAVGRQRPKQSALLLTRAGAGRVSTACAARARRQQAGAPQGRWRRRCLGTPRRCCSRWVRRIWFDRELVFGRGGPVVGGVGSGHTPVDVRTDIRTQRPPPTYPTNHQSNRRNKQDAQRAAGVLRGPLQPGGVQGRGALAGGRAALPAGVGGALVVSVYVCVFVGGGLIVRSRLGVGRKRPSASSPLATQLTASQTTHHPQQPHKKPGGGRALVGRRVHAGGLVLRGQDFAEQDLLRLWGARPPAVSAFFNTFCLSKWFRFVYKCMSVYVNVRLVCGVCGCGIL